MCPGCHGHGHSAVPIDDPLPGEEGGQGDPCRVGGSAGQHQAWRRWGFVDSDCRDDLSWAADSSLRRRHAGDAAPTCAGSKVLMVEMPAWRCGGGGLGVSSPARQLLRRPARRGGGRRGPSRRLTPRPGTAAGSRGWRGRRTCPPPTAAPARSESGSRATSWPATRTTPASAAGRVERIRTVVVLTVP